MTLTLFGDVFLGIFLTMIADRVGRRKILFAGSGLMILSGLVFSYFENFWILLLAAIVGGYSVFGISWYTSQENMLNLCRSRQYDGW
jgi:predicted MFS family arabinose efflux permease